MTPTITLNTHLSTHHTHFFLFRVFISLFTRNDVETFILHKLSNKKKLQAKKISDDVGSGALEHVDIYGPPGSHHALGHQAHPGMIWCVSKLRMSTIDNFQAPVKFQTSYQLVWAHVRERKHFTVWQPVPAKGYVPCGVICKFGAKDRNPPKHNVLCVRADIAQQEGIGQRVWKAQGTGARDGIALGEMSSGLMCVNRFTNPQFRTYGNFVARPTAGTLPVVRNTAPARPGVALYQNAMMSGGPRPVMGGRPAMMRGGPRPAMMRGGPAMMRGGPRPVMGGPRPVAPMYGRSPLQVARPTIPRPVGRRPVRVAPAVRHGPDWYAAHPGYTRPGDRDGDGIPDRMQRPGVVQRPGMQRPGMGYQQQRAGTGAYQPRRMATRGGYVAPRARMPATARPAYGGRPGVTAARNMGGGYGTNQQQRTGYGGY